MTEEELAEIERVWAPVVFCSTDAADAVRLCAEVRRLRSALTATRLDLGRAIDAICNSENWHDEHDDCPMDDTCECELPQRMNDAYERLREFRE